MQERRNSSALALACVLWSSAEDVQWEIQWLHLWCTIALWVLGTELSLLLWLSIEAIPDIISLDTQSHTYPCMVLWSKCFYYYLLPWVHIATRIFVWASTEEVPGELQPQAVTAWWSYFCTQPRGYLAIFCGYQCLQGVKRLRCMGIIRGWYVNRDYILLLFRSCCYGHHIVIKIFLIVQSCAIIPRFII